MNEITDPQRLHTLNMKIQARPITQDPGIQWEVTHAWEVGVMQDDAWMPYYQVEIMNNYGYVLKGVLDSTRGLLYLDVNSIMLLVDDRIESTLAVFNAGHHWRFKGV